MNVKNVWQLAIRSEDGFGNPQAVFSTIIEPYDADKSKLFSYQFAQDSALVDCSPSYAILEGATNDPIYTQLEGIALEWALSRGWMVNVPNHEGPHAAFCVGPQGGRALINSLRAALSSGNITGVDSDAKVVMWGYSGGTIPTGWASSMQPKYAPELGKNLLGAAVGGWVVNVTATAEISDGTIFTGLIPNAVNGILHEYPHIRPYIFNHTVEEKAKVFQSSENLCLIPSLASFLMTKFFSGDEPWFKGGFKVLQQPEVNKVITEVSLGLNDNVGVPKIPMYIFQSKSDDVVPYKPAQKAYEKFCSRGIESMEFYQMEKPDHIFGFIEGAIPSLQWVDDRFAGKEPVKGCKKNVRPKKLEDLGAAIPYKKILQTLYALSTGQKLGEGKEYDVDDLTLLSGIKGALEKEVEKVKKNAKRQL